MDDKAKLAESAYSAWSRLLATQNDQIEALDSCLEDVEVLNEFCRQSRMTLLTTSPSYE